jgi:hypothetical protein
MCSAEICFVCQGSKKQVLSAGHVHGRGFVGVRREHSAACLFDEVEATHRMWERYKSKMRGRLTSASPDRR